MTGLSPGSQVFPCSWVAFNNLDRFSQASSPLRWQDTISGSDESAITQPPVSLPGPGG